MSQKFRAYPRRIECGGVEVEITRMTSSDRDRKIVRSTIGLAHALGQVVVAEGIEDIATFDMLRRMGCDVRIESDSVKPTECQSAVE